MPQIRIKGIQKEDIIKIESQITQSICEITKCPKDYVEIELIDSVRVRDGKITMSAPFIGIYWFERTKEQTDNVAKALTKIVKEIGIQSIDIVFILYEKHLYYENGEHF